MRAAVRTVALAALRVEALRATGGLPPHLVGLFEEPLGFQQTPGGPFYVFDRRAHTAYSVDAAKTTTRRATQCARYS